MRRARIVGLVLLQAAAVVPLVAAAAGERGLGIAIAWSAVVLQLVLGRPRAMLARRMAIALVLGVLGECTLVALGLLRFDRVDPIGLPRWLDMPGWVPPSWALLGAAFTHVLAPLRGRMLASLVVGTLASAVAILGATAAGELTVPPPIGRLAITTIALGSLVALLAISRSDARTRPR
jgi:uncharacterized protein DUF2878